MGEGHEAGFLQRRYTMTNNHAEICLMLLRSGQPKPDPQCTITPITVAATHTQRQGRQRRTGAIDPGRYNQGREMGQLIRKTMWKD